MAISITRQLEGLNGYMSDDEAFRRVYEDHLEIIRNDSKTQEVQVTGKQLEIHRFSWIGLLTELKIPPEMFWFVIRLNNASNWTDLSEDIKIVLVPDGAYIKYLYSTFKSSAKNVRTV